MTAPGGATDPLVRLAEAISQAIGRPIRQDENFFEAGLNSRLLVELHASVTEEMAHPFSVTLMFARPNLRALGRHLASGERVEPAPGRRTRAGEASDPRRAAAARRLLRARGQLGREGGRG